MKTYFERLREIRLKRRLSLQAVAEAINGTEYQIRCWETGKTSPNFFNLLTIADLYEVSLDYLVGRDWNYEEQGTHVPFEDLLTTKELADQLGVSKTTIGRYTEAGVIKPHRGEKNTYYFKSSCINDIQKYRIQQREVKGIEY